MSEPAIILSDSAPSPPAETKVGSIAASLVAAAPQVQEHAIASKLNQMQADALKDKAGEVFNDAIHQKDAQGNPVKTASGTWAKRRGRKAGTVSGSSAPGSTVAGSIVGGTGGAVANPGDQARVTGEGACAAFLTLMVQLGGDEWNPMYDEKLGLDEASQQRKIWGDYFAAKNMRDIPPGIAFALGIASYAGPRFFMPKTRSRLSIARGWITDKVTRVYLWYTGRRGK